ETVDEERAYEGRAADRHYGHRVATFGSAGRAVDVLGAVFAGEADETEVAAGRRGGLRERPQQPASVDATHAGQSTPGAHGRPGRREGSETLARPRAERVARRGTRAEGENGEEARGEEPTGHGVASASAGS